MSQFLEATLWLLDEQGMASSLLALIQHRRPGNFPKRRAARAANLPIRIHLRTMNEIFVYRIMSSQSYALAISSFIPCLL